MKNYIKEIIPLSENKFLSLFEVKYKNKQGTDKSWLVSSRKSLDTLKSQFFNDKAIKKDAVVILPFHKTEKKIVIIKQFRVPINSYIYELPAGLIDDEENIDSTVRRELKEETGLDFVESLNGENKSNLFLSPGMTDECASLIYCTCTGKISTEYLEPDEDIEPMLISKEEARQILSSGDNIDIKCYMALKIFSEIGQDMFKK